MARYVPSGQINVQAVRMKPQPQAETSKMIGHNARGLSARQILRFVPNEPDAANAVYVVVKKIDQRRNKHNGPVLVCTTRTLIPGEDARTHHQRISLRNPKEVDKISSSPAVMFSCDCVTGDTKVLTDKGWELLRSLTNPNLNPMVDFPVNYVVNNKTYPGSAPFYKGVKPVWEIKLNNGQSIKATKNHKIRVLVNTRITNDYENIGRNQSGNKNNNARTWKIFFKDGSIKTVNSLKTWAKENGYKYNFLLGLQNPKKISGKIKRIEKCNRIKQTVRKTVVLGTTLHHSYKWIKVKDLKLGDRVSIHTVKTHERVERDSLYWQSYFAGAFHGDGSFNPFCLYAYDEKYSKMLDLIQEKAGIKLSLSNRKPKGTYLLDHYGYEVLSKFGINSKGRHSFDMNSINIYGFLSGLIDTDGSVGPDGEFLVTGSKNLIKIAKKLQAMGYHTIRYGLYRRKGTETNFGKTTKNSYFISAGAKGADLLRKNLCSIKLDRVKNKKRDQRIQNTAKITDIRYKGKQHVYDIHVPGIHRFVANTMIVHNCARWKFMWEYPMAHRGAAKIIYGNGKPPIETNPGLKPAVCKHGAILLYNIIRRGL